MRQRELKSPKALLKYSCIKQKTMAVNSILISALCLVSVHSFGVLPPLQQMTTSTTNTMRQPLRLYATEDVTSMRVGELKKELESYGISTKSFFEKSELVEALKDAREKGLKPKKKKKKSNDAPSEKASSTSESASSATDSDDPRPREERLAEELTKCMTMKAGELKSELEGLGISTKSFFEKSEFAKALAEARVDGVKKKSSESYAEYADVEVLTDDSSGPRKKQKKEEPQSSGSPFGGGGSPFGDVGGMGGMGGMGGIADMLKNMGGMGGAAPGGGSPFGGGGGASPFGGANPFGGMGGDTMGKAQQMMSNPKVQELLAKAQSNPSLMKKMTEVVSNPAAFAKYQNDPEVAEMMEELKKFM